MKIICLIKIYHFLLSICPNDLISAPNIITFLPKPSLSNNEKLPCRSNPFPYPEKKCLSGSALLVNLTVANKEFSYSKSAACIYDLKFIS